MFKELFASILLSTSFGTPVLKHHTPLRANESYQLHGTYVFRDNFEEMYDYFYETYPNGTYLFSQDFSAIGGSNYYRNLFSYNSNFYYGGFDSFTLGIRKDTSILEVKMYYDMDDNGVSSIIDIDYQDAGGILELTDLYLGADNQNTINYHAIYINNYLRVSKQDFDIFNVFYTSNGNFYNTAYNGYYTFVNNWSNSFYWTVPVTTVVDNNMHDMLTRDTTGGGNNGLIAYSTYYQDTNAQYSTLIYDGENHTYPIRNRTIYLSGLMPNWLFNKFRACGTFGFVPQPVESYTFGEFFFSIIDAPVYYLWSLFNIDLFGLNLFIAFCSMITLCIIVVVIRKVL